jgi:hypothetical protein
MNGNDFDRLRMTLRPLDKVGPDRRGSLRLTRAQIRAVIGFEPNVEDPWGDAWGIVDGEGREAFIWHRDDEDPQTCTNWSVHGLELLRDLFGDAIVDRRQELEAAMAEAS